MNVKRIKACLPYVIFGYVFNRLSWLYGYTSGNVIERTMETAGNVGLAFKSFIPSFYPKDLLVGVIAGASLWGIVYYKRKTAKKYRHGMEYGSARWGNAKDIAPYMDPVARNNVILTATEGLMCSFPTGIMGNFAKPSYPKYARNKNVMVVGGSGSGKTRFFIKPNIMNLHSSFVITDPKGTLVLETGKLLWENGYRIRIFNTINFKRSMKYNPFSYIRSEKDILKLVNTIMANTKGEGSQSGDDFWVKAERLYYTALIGLIYYEAPEEEKNFSMLIDLIDASEVHEDDESFENAVDLIFKELAERDPNHFAVRQYAKYKLAAGVIS